jgi:PleD family two-component response regulator
MRIDNAADGGATVGRTTSRGAGGTMTTEPNIRILVADDHAVVREGIRHVLARQHGFDIAGEAASGPKR